MQKGRREDLSLHPTVKPIALVAGNELAFDMCKAIARTLSPRVLARVFETRQAAEQWLQIVIARASRLAILKASSSSTWMTSSTMSRLSTPGMKPAPMPTVIE